MNLSLGFDQVENILRILLFQFYIRLFQKKWLNNYNEQIRQLVGGELKKQKKMDGFYWMMEKTKYIPENGQTGFSKTNSILVSIITACVIPLFV